MSKQGFLIVSLTIYAAIFTMLVASVARLAMIIFPVMHTLVHWTSYTHFYTAHSFVQQQLSLAPRDPIFFIRCEPKVVTWVTDNRIKSIEEKEGTLLYKEGDYYDGTWHALKTTVLARDCVLAIERCADNTIRCEARLKKEPHFSWSCRQVDYV